MIHRIFSTDSRFKELAFKPGINVLLAEKTSGARKDQTRNAAGKSSSLEIIHYALGSSSAKGSFFANEAFRGQTLGMAFDLSGEAVRVHRPAGPEANRSKVFFTGKLPAYLEKELASGLTDEDRTLGVKQWNEILGRQVFGISPGSKFAPSFRMAFPYFCRLDSDGGMHDPFESWRKQPDWQRDVTLAYLLGLDWNVLSKMEKLRKEESHLEQLRRELKGSGIVGQIIGKTTGLLAKLAVANRRVGELEKQLRDFQVLPEYREIEKEASQIARTIAEMADRNTADLRLIADLEESLAAEKEPAVSDLERLYAAAGVQLPEVTLQRLESVKEFHRTVIRNRKSHLQGEIKAAQKRIADRDAEAGKLQKRQSQLMGLLRTHGALDQFNRLQEELSRFRAERDLLQKQHEVAQKIEKGAADLEVQRATLHQSLIRDITERSARLEEAALLYEELSAEVSERSSILEIEATNKGLRMAITGGPDKSKGIREQQIFCFDMLLAVMQAKRGNSLGFLVHDSHLFDAMDERQVANAIEAGARLSEEFGFQYIITMNSDRIPYGDFSEGFDFTSHIIEPRLTDETESGGLFGFRFDSKSPKT
ncbi:MAG: DUF2326 domain-containing protein [Verrucomicrobiae bacterium]|nr:DUF2326 domain-containing protein [Verrucomicrobiae bacterium]